MPGFSTKINYETGQVSRGLGLSLVKDIVEYAHGRGMKIVAEGIETEAELRKVIELGVDLLQGYFLAKPAASPSEIAPQALSVIRWMNR